MSSQPIEANVVLTSDNSQYDSSMQQSAAQTDQLGKSVDTLTGKINNLAKSAGKKMFGFAAADVAVITAATAAYGAWERQMTSLSAQAAILNRNMDAQKATFNSYASSVNTLRDQFGSTTASAAELVQTLSKVSDNTVPVDKLAATYTKLGAALQESPSNLAASMTQLQRSMGTTQRTTDEMANVVANLTARTNTSGTALVNFANQLAPVGRLVGMSQNDILGLSSAFTKAGQDGFQAANVFSRMMTDVAYASQSGSPDLAKYANLVGMTVQQFKSLGGTDQFLRIFDSINRQGPQAITTLNRMGLDGMRTVRTVTAMAQQSGGLQEALAQAQSGDSGSVDRGSEAAFSTLTHQLAELRSQLTMTGESMGKNFAGPMKMVIDTVTVGARAVKTLTDVFGPLGAVIMEAAVPLAAIAGTVLTLSKITAVAAGIRGITNSSLAYGIREGRAGNAAIGQMRMTPMGPVPYGPQGTVGAAIEKDGNLFQRMVYNAGARFGQALPGEPGAYGRGFRNIGGAGVYGAGYLGGAAARIIGYQYSPMTLGGMNDPTKRDRITDAKDYQELTGRFSGFAKQQIDALRRQFGVDGTPQTGSATGAQTGPAQVSSRTSAFLDSINRSAKGLSDVDKSARGVAGGLSNLSRGLGAMTIRMTSATGGLIKEGAKVGVGVMGSAYEGIFGSNPWMAGIMGAGIGIPLLMQLLDKKQAPITATDQSGILNPYMSAGRLTPASAFSPIQLARNDNRTIQGARYISSTDAMAAGQDYKLSNPQIKGKPQNVVLAMMGAQFSRMRNNPQAVSALAMDLSHQFGPAKAQSMMNQLASGSGYDPQALANYAFKTNDNTKMSQRYSDLFGAYHDRANLVAAQQGVPAAAALQGQQFGQAALMMQQHFGYGLNAPTAADTRGRYAGSAVDKNQNARIAELKSAFKSMGIDVSDDDIKNIRFDTTATSAKGSTRGIISNIFAGGGSRALQNRLRSQYNAEGLTGDAAVNAVVNGMLGNTVDASGRSLTDRIQALQGGQAFGGSAINKALNNVGNVNLQMQGVNSLISRLGAGGITGPAALQFLGNVRATAGSSSEQPYQIAQAAQEQMLRQQSFIMPTLSRTGQFGLQAQTFKSLMGVKAGDEQQQQLQQQEISNFAQQVESQREYFQNLLVQQREFNISRNRAETDFNTQRSRMDYQYNLSRQRAEQDFNLQRQYAEEDYQRSRAREEQDFHISQTRAQVDYNLQLKRSYQDYTISRMRQEQDFNHSVTLMVKQQAEQYADIYKRVQVQRTTSAGYVVFNASEQLKQMRQQSADLNTLRARGLSNAAIQQLKLTDPNNAQQLNRMVGDTAQDPKLIKQLNEAISARLKAARALVTDESSQDWEEFNRQYKLARERGKEDFTRQVDRSHADFQKQMSRQEDDFQRSLNRQGQDFQIAQGRQEDQFHLSMSRAAKDYQVTTDNMTHDFHLSMKRAADDLERQSETIDGNMTQILTKATKKLSGHARQQAMTVLQEFHGLSHSTTGISTDLMKMLSEIFGIPFKAPKSTQPSSQAKRWQGELSDFQKSQSHYAAGGVLPGFSPGHDNHTYVSPTGGTLHLSGGEAIMRPEWTRAVGGEKAVQAMNDAARSGAMQGARYAAGGVFWPTTGHRISTYAGHDGVDINGPGQDYGNPIFAYRSGRIVYTGWGHGYGDAIFEQPSIGPEVVYGHGSAVYVHAGQHVRGGQMIGRVGATGNATGPHLHFGIPGGTYAEALALLQGATNVRGPVAQGMSAGASGFAAALQLLYPGPEKHAANMSGIHPFEQGDISHVINSHAIAAYRRLVKKYGNPYQGDPMFGNVPSAPVNVTGNKALVKQMAAARGWGSGSEWDALYSVLMRESGFNNLAQNPTSSAYGMFQFLDSTWGGYGVPKTSDPRAQTIAGLRYIARRYHDPLGALTHERNFGWYGNGAIFSKGPQTIGVGESGPEMVLPLDDRGAEFLTALMRKILPGSDARGTNTAGFSAPATIHNMHAYQIDKSTTFSGPITVQANDPNQLITQLQQRARLSALSNAAKGGVKVA